MHKKLLTDFYGKGELDEDSRSELVIKKQECEMMFSFLIFAAGLVVGTSVTITTFLHIQQKQLEAEFNKLEKDARA